MSVSVSAASSCRSPQAFFKHFYDSLDLVEKPGMVQWTPRLEKILYQRAESERKEKEEFTLCLRHFGANTMGAESLPEK